MQGFVYMNSIFMLSWRQKKIVRIQKRIVEENTNRTERHARPIISTMADDIVEAMMSVKQIMDHQVYDRNDFWKKVAYFA